MILEVNDSIVELRVKLILNLNENFFQLSSSFDQNFNLALFMNVRKANKLFVKFLAIGWTFSE